MAEFRLYLRETCLINPPPAPPVKAALGAALLGLFVPKLIETAIGGIANALKEAGEDDTKQVTADEFCDLVERLTSDVYRRRLVAVAHGEREDPEAFGEPGYREAW